MSVLESILHRSWVQWADNHYLVLHGHNTAHTPPHPHLLKEVTNYAATHCLHSLTKKAQFTAPVWATHTALTKSMYSTTRPQDIARKAYNKTLQYCYHSLKGIIIGGQIIGHIVTTKTCNIQPDNRPHSPEKA